MHLNRTLLASALMRNDFPIAVRATYLFFSDKEILRFSRFAVYSNLKKGLHRILQFNLRMELNKCAVFVPHRDNARARVKSVKTRQAELLRAERRRHIACRTDHPSIHCQSQLPLSYMLIVRLKRLPLATAKINKDSPRAHNNSACCRYLLNSPSNRLGLDGIQIHQVRGFSKTYFRRIFFSFSFSWI